MPEDVFGIVGTMIAGAYQVESVVAEGRFSVVYRAHHGGFRAPVALKLLKVPQQSAAQRTAFLQLFRAETALLLRLSARLPAVVRPLHVDALTTPDGRLVPCIVMEWLDGLTLHALIQQRFAAGQTPVPLRKLVRLLTPVARALECAHNFSSAEGAGSVVHLDLTPENMFIAQVAGEEVVKVLDLGLANLKSAVSQIVGRLSQHASAAIAFTPAYGAPEQWAPRDYGETGPWTDVWGLSLCIVETLAARAITNGDASAMMGIALDPARRPTPRQEGVEVSDAVEGVFARALALDPRARQRDVGVFWNELTAALELPEPARSERPPHEVRAEGTAPQIELVELHSRPPRMPAPRIKVSNPGLERVLASDLEFDPTSLPHSSSGTQPIAEHARVAEVELAPSSGSHFVPDLELAPPIAARRQSGAQPLKVANSSSPTVLELDDASGDAAASLDLDLPSDEPISIRAHGAARMAAVPARAPASGIVRDSRPPISGALMAPPSANAASAPNSAARSPRASVPPVAPASALPGASLTQLDLSKYEERPLSRRLRLAFALLGGAILVSLLDPIYAAATGEVLHIVGLRLSVFGAALLVLAIAAGAREALRAPAA